MPTALFYLFVRAHTGRSEIIKLFLISSNSSHCFSQSIKGCFNRRLQKKACGPDLYSYTPQKKYTVHFYQWLTGDSLLAVILMVLMALDGGLTAALSAC